MTILIFQSFPDEISGKTADEFLGLSRISSKPTDLPTTWAAKITSELDCVPENLREIVCYGIGHRVGDFIRGNESLNLTTYRSHAGLGLNPVHFAKLDHKSYNRKWVIDFYAAYGRLITGPTQSLPYSSLLKTQEDLESHTAEVFKKLVTPCLSEAMERIEQMFAL